MHERRHETVHDHGRLLELQRCAYAFMLLVIVPDVDDD
jgi:hypothetical protein